ncbi:MAG: VCBS repeat-containing protein, partial [Verrucomicrobia bacterium]|nr:VCBS repeat-containing protein [Verrucomicrobiota bacterium]
TLSGLTAGVTYYVRAYAVNGGGTSYGYQQSFVLSAAPFAELDPGFRAAGWYARSAWGDYDNDSDLDLFLAGYDAGATPMASARIYHNNGDGTFTDVNAGLPNVEFGTWGDYDRDGDLDLVVSGLVYETNTRVTEIYRNDNGSFVSLNAGLTPVEYAELAWGDYDNDGDLDLVVAGDDATGVPRTTLYRNDGGVFVNANAGLLGVDSAGLAWGDYDNDGDLDLALSGYTGPGASHARLYRNDGGTFVWVDVGLVQAGDGTVAWGDYDNDGDLDLLLSGSVDGLTEATRLYRNNGNGTFSENTAAGLKDIYGAAAWGDYDNDGDLDLVLSGAYGANVSFTDVYRNNGDGTFTALNLGLRPLQGGAAVWGDCDNDGDLDLLLAGYSETDDAEYTRLYRNNTGIWNTPPAAPTGLSASVTGGVASLSWNAATDAETPASGLTYNLRIGTGPEKNDVLSGMANLTTGQRRLPALGNVNHNTSWAIRGLADGTYYWSLQAVDSTLAGGTWAAAGSFPVGTFYHLTATTGTHGTITPTGSVAVLAGGSAHFTITPDAYYHVADVTKNGVSVGAVTDYSWTNVTADGTLHAVFAPDLAANGTPHWWLAQHGWTNNFDLAEAADTDGDGQFAGQEYLADTNPTAASSVFRVIGFVSRPTVAVTCASSASRLYTLYRSTDLAAGAWLPVFGQTDVAGTGSPLILHDPTVPQPARCFYRIGVRLP